MNESLIRWTKDDKVNLRKAVNNFNNKIRRLEKEGRENLPKKVSYKELVGISKGDDLLGNEIYSRRELRNTINSLKRFSRRGAEKVVELPSGQKITEWQKREIGYQKARATRNINKRIEGLSNKLSFGMGNKELQELKGTLESIRNLGNKKGTDFVRGLQTLLNNARSDRELRMSTVWANNFKSSLEELSGYENFELLKNAVEKIKNPIKLYEYISQTEILKDFFLWYHDKATSQTYGGFSDNQEAFNQALVELGLLNETI